MELKPDFRYPGIDKDNLLIVPYGIETSVKRLSIYQKGLLIVPYGIETKGKEGYIGLRDFLLIVPYGIETMFPIANYP